MTIRRWLAPPRSVTVERAEWLQGTSPVGVYRPSVYSVDGRQYIVINTEGSKGRANDPTGGKYIAFALPH